VPKEQFPGVGKNLLVGVQVTMGGRQGAVSGDLSEVV
jgi:hypothetical protein